MPPRGDHSFHKIARRFLLQYNLVSSVKKQEPIASYLHIVRPLDRTQFLKSGNCPNKQDYRIDET